MTVFTAAELRPALEGVLASGEIASELDLSQVAEFDTAGLQIVLAAMSRQAATQHPLKVGAASRAVRDVLELFHQTHLLGTSAAEVTR